MPTKKKNVTPDYVLRANKNYKSKFKQIVLLVPDEAREIIKANTGEKSMNQYIIDLIAADLKKKGIDLPER